jgi:hypothetical protein
MVLVNGRQSVALGIELECVKDRQKHHIPNCGEERLGVLERAGKLLQHLPNAVEKEKKERRLFALLLLIVDVTEAVAKWMTQSHPFLQKKISLSE